MSMEDTPSSSSAVSASQNAALAICEEFDPPNFFTNCQGINFFVVNYSDPWQYISAGRYDEMTAIAIPTGNPNQATERSPTAH
jgi:hypothetical protein